MSLQPRRLVLATDLDGTMALGDAALRARLVERLRGEGGGALVYVTGRSVEATLDLAARVALPEPDVLIADVGTSVLHGFGPERVVPIEAALEGAWPGADAVRSRLEALEGDLVPQGVRAPRRVSWWIEAVRRMRSRRGEEGDAFAAVPADDPSLGEGASALARAVARRASERLDGLGVDVLLSANVFLDVLPGGVHKGSTLRRVLAWLGAAEDDCVVAGDSLNDLGLFETGMRGVVVGNCEPALLRSVAGFERVYHAAGEGVGGVLEGLRHHGHLVSDTQGGERRGE